MSEIYIHIGIHKTASTFLQNRIFPHWPDISYLDSRKILYRMVRKVTRDKILISNECFSGVPWINDDWGWKRERRNCLDTLNKLFPEAKIILFVRKQWLLMLSFYKQYLQEGGSKTFNDFFNLHSTSLLRPEDLFFKDLIHEVEKIFTNEILILDFDIFKRNKQKVFKELSLFMNTAEPHFTEEILKKKDNLSVKYYPSQFLRLMNSFSNSPMNPDGFLPLNHFFLKRNDLHPRGLCQYRLNKYFSKELKLDNKVYDDIKEYYRSDWQDIQSKIS